MRWAQFLLLGHLYVFALTVYKGWPLLVPLMVSFGPFYNGWLFFLCNSTQHVGLWHGDFRPEKGRPVVNDFRLTTRTFYVGNPLVQFWCVCVRVRACVRRRGALLLPPWLRPPPLLASRL